MTRPIFLFSLPRAGSTLLQRLLLTDGRCTTAGEPTFLLRFLGEDDVVQRRATYGEGLVRYGHADLRNAWSGFDRTYRDGVRNLALSIFAGISGGRHEWFLDKTPRYHLIAEEIVQTFPDAKFILLWRHPLAVAASISSTFRRGRWHLNENDIDLHAGMERLFALRERHAPIIHELRYEDLVSNPAAELTRLGCYLGWPDLPSCLDKPLVTNNQGQLGDPTGIKKYQSVSQDSRDAWQKDYHNWYRRSWARDYYASPRGRLAEKLGYTLPIWPDAAPIGMGAGLTEKLGAAWRRHRKLTHPVYYRRFARDFARKHGYLVNFS